MINLLEREEAASLAAGTHQVVVREFRAVRAALDVLDVFGAGANVARNRRLRPV